MSTTRTLAVTARSAAGGPAAAEAATRPAMLGDGGDPSRDSQPRADDAETAHWIAEYGGFLGLGGQPPYVADLQTCWATATSQDTSVLRCAGSAGALTIPITPKIRTRPTAVSAKKALAIREFMQV